jgi:hypothetical protein
VAVQRSGQSSYWSFNELAPRTRLYREDVESLLKLIRDKGATARLVSGDSVELESSDDIPSLSGKELRELSIKTRHPDFTIDLMLKRAGVISIDQSSGAQEFGNAVVGFLRQHHASGWERVWLEVFRNRFLWGSVTAVFGAGVVTLIVGNGLSPLLLFWLLGPLVGCAVVAAFNGTGTWVTRRTRADVIQRQEERRWAIAGFIGTSIGGALLGAGVTYVLTR